MRTTVPVYISSVTAGQGIPPAELIGGACRTPQGVAIMDKYMDAPMGDKSVASKNARSLCRRCQVLAACEAWIMRAESSPGAWHGMYAGMTPKERKWSFSERAASAS